MIFQKLPNWVQLGAFLLALNAGMINVLGLLTVLHQSVSHMTGNVSMFAIALSHLDGQMMLYVFLIACSFMLGSFYSGFILGNANLEWGRHYGIPLVLVSFFIVMCWFFLSYFPRYALLWAAAAMGVQNAMFSHYRGMIIRTTHLSGIFTDIGLALGYKARGLAVDPRRLLLHVLILMGFLSGGMIATVLHHYLLGHAFLCPALLSSILSMTYWYLYLKRSQLKEIPK